MSANLLFALLVTFFLVIFFLMVHKKEKRWRILLLFSLVYYSYLFELGIILLLLFSIIIFFGGQWIQKKPGKKTFNTVLFISLLPLLAYKFHLLSGSSHVIFNKRVLFELAGISYYTFNGLSYLFDIRRGYTEPAKKYGILLLYLSYFPCILSGPLHRFKNLSEKFINGIEISNENFSSGFRFILWGLFKKAALAEPFKNLCDTLLDNPTNYHGPFVLLGGLFFFFELYCEFSAYVDIATGISKIFGIEINPNFKNRIYMSASRTSFWAGWHITLNKWFRDYLFFPLAKGISVRWKVNLILLFTMILIGLWHEISGKFLLWGFLNGCWILAEINYSKYFNFLKNAGRKYIGVVYHLIFASFMAIIFRSNHVWLSLQAIISNKMVGEFDPALILQIGKTSIVFLLMDYINRKTGDSGIDKYLGSLSTVKRWAVYILFSLLIMSYGFVYRELNYYIRF